MSKETGERGENSESGWDRLKVSSHTAFIVELGGVFDEHYTPAWLSKEHSKGIFTDGFLSIYEPRPTGLNFGEQMGRGVSAYSAA